MRTGFQCARKSVTSLPSASFFLKFFYHGGSLCLVDLLVQFLTRLVGESFQTGCLRTGHGLTTGNPIARVFFRVGLEVGFVGQDI